jgi:glycosyltransferase involved in cell wall biosynthesis
MNAPARSDGLRIAVVICTLRRPDSLARTLQSIAQALPLREASAQVVVVDNGDCAATRAVAEGFRDRLPLTLLSEPRTGLARARNAAIGAVACDYFIWTDDDVEVAPQWLRVYEAAFAANPEAAFFGGPIRPRFEGNPPRWLIAGLPLVYTAFAGLDLADQAIRFDRDTQRLPFGANMAVRSREQRDLRYDVELGRQPGAWMLGGEESDLLRRIRDAGGVGIWVPEAGVTHWIDPSRQSIGYLRRYYEGMRLVEARARLRNGKALRSDPDATWRDLLRSEVTYLYGRLVGNPQIWVGGLKEASRLRALLAAQRMLDKQGNLTLEARQ